MKDGIILIVTKPTKKVRKPEEPKKFWGKHMNDTQRHLFICALDDLDRDATRKGIVPKRAG